MFWLLFFFFCSLCTVLPAGIESFPFISQRRFSESIEHYWSCFLFFTEIDRLNIDCLKCTADISIS